MPEPETKGQKLANWIWYWRGRLLKHEAAAAIDLELIRVRLDAYKDCHRENECRCCEQHPDTKDDRCYIGACIWDLEQEMKSHGKSRATAS